MSKRKNRLDPVRPPVGDLGRRSTVAPARSTLRVAAANRLLAETLPKVVFHEKTVSKRAVARVASPVRLDSARPAQRVGDLTIRRDAPLSHPRDEHLKCRPKDSRQSGGGGASRSFVPWSKDRDCS